VELGKKKHVRWERRILRSKISLALRLGCVGCATGGIHSAEDGQRRAAFAQRTPALQGTDCGAIEAERSGSSGG